MRPICDFSQQKFGCAAYLAPTCILQGLCRRQFIFSSEMFMQQFSFNQNFYKRSGSSAVQTLVCEAMVRVVFRAVGYGYSWGSAGQGIVRVIFSIVQYWQTGFQRERGYGQSGFQCGKVACRVVGYGQGGFSVTGYFLGRQVQLQLDFSGVGYIQGGFQYDTVLVEWFLGRQSRARLVFRVAGYGWGGFQGGRYGQSWILAGQGIVRAVLSMVQQFLGRQSMARVVLVACRLAGNGQQGGFLVCVCWQGMVRVVFNVVGYGWCGFKVVRYEWGGLIFDILEIFDIFLIVDMF